MFWYVYDGLRYFKCNSLWNSHSPTLFAEKETEVRETKQHSQSATANDRAGL